MKFAQTLLSIIGLAYPISQLRSPLNLVILLDLCASRLCCSLLNLSFFKGLSEISDIWPTVLSLNP
jgi:hypothetical protein